MQIVYLITVADEYHLMYDLSDEFPVYITLGDVQQQVDHLNSTEPPVEYGDFENKKYLPRYSYKQLQTNMSFQIQTQNTKLHEQISI